ncbi:MAG: LemA family protein [Bacteroidaceae bacterium]|jgi:LemA protein|nr:LemA family protein [Bacteroidaceae bacterium]MBP3833095.1 LemA family protein [Bacteroidaceae bacterium]MBQ9676359.1 LemA family protein [Bacteroidaceae bacterium]
MKKSTIGLIAVIAIIAFWLIGVYNGMVGLDEGVNTAWANVETQYQRRADLIPNLVNTVKGYAQHEQSTFEAVVNARSKATSITIDPSNVTPEKLQEFQQAQGELASALGRLIAISENYPDLKASEQFKELQAQLEGTENRINVARTNFNNEAKKYNTTIRTFPRNMFAGMLGFTQRAYFEAEAGANQAPKVEF